jgi:hypothetical protein
MELSNEMKKKEAFIKPLFSGEYRIRTDDLYAASVAL